MGAKDTQNAENAKKGADSQPDTSAPDKNQPPVQDCKNKHFIGVRVEWEDNSKPVETGITMKLKLNNGTTSDISLAKGIQDSGKYSTGKILDSTAACEISFPNLYDAECRPK